MQCFNVNLFLISSKDLSNTKPAVIHFLFCLDVGHGRYICLDSEKVEDRDVLHKIVESEAYSEKEFAEAVTKLGKNW